MGAVRIAAVRRFQALRARGVYTVDFSALAVGPQSIPGVTVTRAGSATVQTGTSTLEVAAADTARVGREDDSHETGLLIEESSTNLVQYSDAISNGWWAKYGGPTIVAGGAVAPDGATPCDTIEDADTGVYVEAAAFGLNAFSPVFFSAWCKRLSGTTGGLDRHDILVPIPAGTEWQRVKAGYVAQSVGGAFGVIPAGVSGNINAPTGKFSAFGLQAEAKKFALSVKQSSGANATCAGDNVTIPRGVIARGRLSLALRCRPLGARADYDHALRVLTASAATWAEIDQTTGLLYVCVQGVLWTSTGALTWSAGDTLELWIEAGGGVVESGAWYRVNGGTAVSLGKSSAPQPEAILSTLDVVNLCCREGSQQLSSWVVSVSSKRPSWAGAPSGTATALTTLPVRVVPHGNSLVYGLDDAALASSLGLRFSVEKRGTPFIQISGLLLNSETAPIDAQFSPHTQVLWVFEWEGTNSMVATLTADENTPPSTVAALALSDHRAYVAGRRAAGAMVAVGTVMKRGDLTGIKASSFESARQIFNAALLSDRSCGDFAVDIGGHALLQDPLNATYFSDRLHLTPAGSALVIAAIVAEAQRLFP